MKFLLAVVCLVAVKAQNLIPSDVDHISGDGRKYLAASSDCDLDRAECLPGLTCDGYERTEDGLDVTIRLGLCKCTVENFASDGCAAAGGNCNALFLNGVCGTCIASEPYDYFTAESAANSNGGGVWCGNICDDCTDVQTCDIDYTTGAHTCVDPPTPAPTPTPTPTPTPAPVVDVCADHCDDETNEYFVDGEGCFCDDNCAEFEDCCPGRDESCADVVVEEPVDNSLCARLSSSIKDFCPSEERDHYTSAWMINLGRSCSGSRNPVPSSRQPADNRCVLGTNSDGNRGKYLKFACTPFGTVVAKECDRKGCDDDDCEKNYSSFYDGTVQAGKCFDSGDDGLFFVCDVNAMPRN